jgi:SnoaL-like protein
LQANAEEIQMQEFRDAVESRDLDALGALFTDDIVFRSPAVHAPYRGRAQVKALLRAVGQVLDDFRYTRQIGAPDAADHALVFRARVGDREVEACDFIHVNGDGLIDELYVMVRPLSGLLAMAEAMKRQLGLDDSGEQVERQAAVYGSQ